MIIETARFGNLEIGDENVIHFTGGLIGFEENKKFILVDHDRETSFQWLQSVDTPDLAFVVMEPFIFYPEYSFDLSERDLYDLESPKAEEIAVLSILVVPEETKKITANLKAPLVINIKNKKGKQIIINNDAYPIKYYLFQEGK